MTRSAKPSLTERRAEELRLEIALTARDLFVAGGDTSATVERICEIVGIAPRTFHRHFPVKEDVIMPLLRSFGEVSLQVLEQSGPNADPVDTLVHAFTTEVAERHVEEFDRKFMTLIVKDAQYRLRWLDWGEDLSEPITEFLARHFHLGEDPFLRTLPAHLIIETARQVYIQWIDSGDFAQLEASHRAAMQMILSTLRRRG
ncbi:TetR/AcrR family transcriptional regulator [Mycobacterium sp.]|uniref:TetR/AcrR family transcriptional regulator n=1 Tax=Mycobacterium sp. TaxID=1785 RepID=UPI003F99824D